jgi:hypothetical protein
MYDLTTFGDSRKDVVLCPITHTNIARFINCPGPDEKANVN